MLLTLCKGSIKLKHRILCNHINDIKCLKPHILMDNDYHNSSSNEKKLEFFFFIKNHRR